MDILARGRHVITSADGDTVPDGGVYMAEGRVVAVDRFDKLKQRYPHAEVKGDGTQILMPGLVDGHSHGAGFTSVQAGMGFDYLENLLFDWAALPPVDVRLNAALSAVRHLRNGCTTMHLNYFGEEPNRPENAVNAIEGALGAGIRLCYSPGGRNINALALDDEEFLKTLPRDLQEFAAPMVHVDREAIADAYLELFDSLRRQYHDERTRVILGPSWPQGCTDDFLQKVKSRSEELGGVPIHLHTLQTPVQKAYGLRTYGKSLLGHLDDLGFVDDKLVLGHAVFLDEKDIELLASRNSSVTHHPSCNLAVRNGIAPVYHLYRAGVNVAMGIDDKGINDDEDAFMELRLIHRLHRVPGFDLAHTPPLSGRDVLRIGTVNGARVCGFGGEVGELKQGMRADAVLLDTAEISRDPWVSPELDPIELVIHRAKGMHVNTVLVDGKVVMEEGRFRTIDVEALYKEVRKQAQRQMSKEQADFVKKMMQVKPYCQRWYAGWDDLRYRPFYPMNSRE